MPPKALPLSDAARHLLALKQASTSFLHFVKLIYPTWTLAPFQIELINALDAFEKDTLPEQNLLVTMPPRFAKSTFSTVLFPSYCMARDPERFIMSCSYNSQLAIDFGRQVRSTIDDPRLTQAFPHFHQDPSSSAADVWRTTDGGAYFAVGIGGTTSGRPANILIVDDPIKSRTDAESMTQRNNTWNYYTSALATRLQPDTHNRKSRQIVVLTRWHPDDLAGRLQQTEDWAEGRWKHVNFQAITETSTHLVNRDCLPPSDPEYANNLALIPKEARAVRRATEKSLWPSRFPLDDLQRRRRLNPREFASLYQQEPTVEGGNLIKANWWQTYPDDITPNKFSSIVIACDTAFKKNEQADYSVSVVAGMDTAGDIYIIDVQRGRYEFPELKSRMINLSSQWRGRGLRGLYIEDKASGQSLIQELKRQSGISVIPVKQVHDKVARTNAVLPLIEGGRVYLPSSAPWLDKFVEECSAFPGGTHDDQVDAVVMALEVLSKSGLPLDLEAMSLNAINSLNNNPDQYGKSLSEQLLGKHRASNPWKGWGR